MMARLGHGRVTGHHAAERSPSGCQPDDLEAPDRQVSDFLFGDVAAAMERMAARRPFVAGKFSRCAVYKRFRAGEHHDLARQQMWQGGRNGPVSDGRFRHVLKPF
ncbi:MAG: hypothetical protein F4213_02580 [Boseongicola sp. SB0677_bin_26]|nr:hypothetical protein [Boseongicola sp. SB0665_bin_10]MYG24903.1 hypothetical protein [Boseongicola sp. SB0677_bin_26]